MRHLPDLLRDLDRPFLFSANRDFDRPLTSWRPLLRQLDDLFTEIASGTDLSNNMHWSIPSSDVEERDDCYILTVDMPGLEKENIGIEVQGNQLMVSGEQKWEAEEGYTRRAEHRYRRFERSLTLPSDAKGDLIEAEYRNGVLSIVIPKSAQTKKQRVKIGESKGGFLNKLLGHGSKTEKRAIDAKEADSTRAH